MILEGCVTPDHLTVDDHLVTIPSSQGFLMFARSHHYLSLNSTWLRPAVSDNPPNKTKKIGKYTWLTRGSKTGWLSDFCWHFLSNFETLMLKNLMVTGDASNTMRCRWLWPTSTGCEGSQAKRVAQDDWSLWAGTSSPDVRVAYKTPAFLITRVVSFPSFNHRSDLFSFDGQGRLLETCTVLRYCQIAVGSIIQNLSCIFRFGVDISDPFHPFSSSKVQQPRQTFRVEI